MQHLLYGFITLHFSACSEKIRTEEFSQEASMSDTEIQALIHATDMPEEERDAIEEQMINLREDCANGDNDACEELRALIEELEGYREDERIEDEREDREISEIESNECAEVSRVAYEDCLNVGGSEEDCREEAAVAYEDCLDR